MHQFTSSASRISALIIAEIYRSHQGRCKHAFVLLYNIMIAEVRCAEIPIRVIVMQSVKNI
jgi:hypothetical protein